MPCTQPSRVWMLSITAGCQPKLLSLTWKWKQIKDRVLPVRNRGPLLWGGWHSWFSQLAPWLLSALWWWCHNDCKSDSSQTIMENHDGIISHRTPASSLAPWSPLTNLCFMFTCKAGLFYFHLLWIRFLFQFGIKKQWVRGNIMFRLKEWALEWNGLELESLVCPLPGRL